MTRWLRALGRRMGAVSDPALFAVLLLFALLVIGSLHFRGFFALQVFLNLFIDNAYLVVLAVGMSVVILSGGIDLSVGATLALSTLLVATLLQTFHWPVAAVLALTLFVGLLFGGAMGALIHYFRLPPFIVTLAGMFLMRGLCYLISIDSIPIDDPWFVELSRRQIPLFGGFLSAGVVVALVVLGVALATTHLTPLGRSIYALGGSEESATAMGLPVAQVKIFVYACSGFCATLAGLLFSNYMLSGYALHAQGAELDAIAAVVIGGTLLTGGQGGVAGALWGVLVLGTIQTMLVFDGSLSSWWSKIAIGALLLAFCLGQKTLPRWLAWWTRADG